MFESRECANERVSEPRVWLRIQKRV
ncbi:hypothetical protein CGLO_11222 [Colletotrichum gloeosporioides Cg-14]|uniref:Uncharacterized protein n=1 Tax=Colletotrichum gloeosporioides (strain Cg-14) TaxID=1237896 RepID=T0LCM8_COLGC|nr:hypothetical protein CGLO_11222 [Colletotrichum gloeosporioides Cg-14]